MLHRLSATANTLLHSGDRLILLLLFCLALPTAVGWSQEAALSVLVGKTVTQRHFFAGPEVVYDDQGTAQGSKTCPWTMCGRILIRAASRHGDQIIVEGERQHLAYDFEEKRFIDVMDILTGPGKLRERFHTQKLKGDALKEIRKEKAVRIVIHGTGGWNDALTSAALGRIFLGPGESMADVAGPEWQFVLCETQGFSTPARCTPRSPDALPAGVFKVGGGVKAPRAISAADPEYSDAARNAKFQGTVILRVVVTSEGQPSQIEITRPTGLGLDERAMEAVSQWRFKPATRTGEPVAVQVNVEVNFRLY